MKNNTPCASRRSLLVRSIVALALTTGLGSCANRVLSATQGVFDPTTRALRAKIDTIVVIYAENRAFDNLYGNFPGARGLSDVVDRDGRPLPAYVPQVDRNGSVLPALPPAWGT
jgi:phospholipase C